MKFSVLMSVYCKDHPKKLKDSLESLLIQTRLADEHIIVIDGPIAPELENIINEYQKKLPDTKLVGLNKNLGLGLALHEGFKHCTFEWIARMDADDACVPQRFEWQCQYIKAHPEVDILGGNIKEIDEEGRLLHLRQVPTSHKEILDIMSLRNPLNHVSVFIRKSLILKAGSYQDNPGYEDYELWMRAKKNGAVFANLSEVLVKVFVNKDFYHRRWGFNFFKKELSFQKKIFLNSCIGTFEFFRNIILRALPRLLPIAFAKTFYKYLLREGSSQNAL